MGIPSNVSRVGCGMFSRLHDGLVTASLPAPPDTAAQQIAWAGAMLAGPSDAADLDTLIKKSSAMTDAEVPTTTSAWVSPVDGSRSALAGAKVASGRWNSGIGDLTAFTPCNRAWIENIA